MVDASTPSLPDAGGTMDSSDLSDFFLSGASSPLSDLSRSPSPPSSYFPTVGRESYPSPPSSQSESSKASPAPEGMTSIAQSHDDDKPPAAKRRKIQVEPAPSKTQYLNLASGELSESDKPALDKLLSSLRDKRKIVVVAGAGISVSAGIPDFRSSSGLFASLKKEHNLKASGKQLFDASVYRDATATFSFHQMIRNLSKASQSAKPTLFHHLLDRLSQEERLLRLYTQNVDGLELQMENLGSNHQIPLPAKAPFPQTIQLHGGLSTMVCIKCHQVSPLQPDLFDSAVPPSCPKCEEKDDCREAAGLRSHGIGRLRPRMVLYHEHNPDDEAIGTVAQADLRARPDALIVVGTTLKVPGIRRIVREMCGVVKGRKGGVTIWISNDPEPQGKDMEGIWHLAVKGDCDEVARRAMDKLNETKLLTELEFQERKNQPQEFEIRIPQSPVKTGNKSDHSLPTPQASPSKRKQSIGADTKQITKPRTPTKTRTATPKKTQSLTLRVSKKPAEKSKKAPAKRKATATKPDNKISGHFKAIKPQGHRATQAKGFSASGKVIPDSEVEESEEQPSNPGKATKMEAEPMQPLSPQALRNNSISPRKSARFSTNGHLVKNENDEDGLSGGDTDSMRSFSPDEPPQRMRLHYIMNV